MINLMRADMYRILRGKGIYICFAIMLAVILLTVYVMRIAPTMGVSGEVVIEGFEFEDRALQDNYMSGASSATMAIGAMNNMIYIFLPLLIIVSMAAFSSRAVKNELTVGIGRVKFYLSKLFLGSILSFVFMALYLVLSVALAATVDGMGYWGSGFFTEIMQAFGLQILLLLGFVSMGVFFGFLTRRTSATIGLYIALALVPSIIISILSGPFPRALNAFYYDLSGLYFHFARPGDMTGFEICRGIIVSLVYIAVSTIAGLVLFKRAEIR